MPIFKVTANETVDHLLTVEVDAKDLDDAIENWKHYDWHNIERKELEGHVNYTHHIVEVPDNPTERELTLLHALKTVMPWAAKAVADHPHNQTVGNRALHIGNAAIEKVEKAPHPEGGDS